MTSPLAKCAKVMALALLAAAALSGCRGSGTGAGSATNSNGPLQLDAGPHGVAGASSVLVPVDRKLADRDIENYRINKKRAKGPYKLQGVDLDGDGVGEALVLFEGKDWCKSTGCSLAIFKADGRGYKPVFRTVSVKPPVIVTRDENQGWRDLIVTSGGGRAPTRRVLLRFSGLGYPRNAMLEPEAPTNQPIDGQVAVAAPGASGLVQTSPMRAR